MSPQQSRVFAFVRDRCAAGLPPLSKEIAEALGMSAENARGFVSTLIRARMLGRNTAIKRGLFVPGGPDLRRVSTQELRLELERRGEMLEHVASEPSFGGGKTCAADTCGESVERGNFFCRRHWFQLPKDLRTEVLETFFARRQDDFQTALTRARDIIDGCPGPFDRVGARL